MQRFRRLISFIVHKVMVDKIGIPQSTGFVYRCCGIVYIFIESTSEEEKKVKWNNIPDIVVFSDDNIIF